MGDNGTGSIVAQTASDSAGPLNVTVTTGSDIVCTITNTRETGKLEVVKELNPTSDPGKFNLQIDGNTDPNGANVGDGGSTGEETLNTGTHNVGEAAGTGTSLTNYSKSIVCKTNNGTGVDRRPELGFRRPAERAGRRTATTSSARSPTRARRASSR